MLPSIGLIWLAWGQPVPGVISMRFIRFLARFLFLLFLVPAMASAGLWLVNDHPDNWRVADWSSADILPDPASARQARIVIFSARTGGFKGAFSVHSWIVTKAKDQPLYDRYDVVGWGKPVRKNAYVADGRWYSNDPVIVAEITGPRAESLIPRLEAAIAAYPHASKGDYRMWPGPNSNTFVATILRNVPELDATLPPNAVGRDFPDGPLPLRLAFEHGDLSINLFGVAGLAAGRKSGLELQFMGLVAGLDLAKPGVKIPAFGRFGM